MDGSARNPLVAHRTGYIAAVPSHPTPGVTFSFGGYSRRDPEGLRRRSSDEAVIVSMKRARWLARKQGWSVEEPGVTA